jgi:hypothetical protein
MRAVMVLLGYTIPKNPVCLCVLFFLFCSGSAPAFAQESQPRKPAELLKAYLTLENRRKLENGETLFFKQAEKDGAGKAKGQGATLCLVNAPLDQTWKHLRAYEFHADFFPRLTQVKKYYEEGNRLGLECWLKVAWKTVHYHVLQTWDDQEHTMTWVLDTTKENDILETTGIWIVYPYDEKRTLIFYSMYADTGMFIPAPIERYLLNRDLPNVVEALKKRVETQGTYRK